MNMMKPTQALEQAYEHEKYEENLLKHSNRQPRQGTH